MDEQRLKYLFEQFTARTATDEEVEAFYQAIMDPAEQDAVKALIGEDWESVNPDLMRGMPEHRVREIYEGVVKTQQEPVQERPRRMWPKIAIAASVVVSLSAGAYFFLINKPATPVELAKGEEKLPIQQGVVLTTGGGQQIALYQQYHGQLKANDGTSARQDSNALDYRQAAEAAAPVTHTLTNNSGYKFSLTLADGTEVYLDAASAVTYPTAFTGKERRIAISGQAYLKVKHNRDQPFRVDVENETVEDIGTEFNINAYGDRPGIRTTLVEGAARVALPKTQQAVLLKPGQQAVLNDTELEVKPADLEEVTAWLQGKLVFSREPLENIMKKIARIYNVEVVWVDADLKKLEIGGSTNTTKKLANVLNFFRKTGQVDFSVEGRTVKVFKPKKH